MAEQQQAYYNLGDILLDFNTDLFSTAEALAKANYQKFLETLLNGRHPAFCELVWTGKVFLVVLLLHFQKVSEAENPMTEEGQVMREAAWAEFQQIPMNQRRFVHIKVFVRNFLPMTAEVYARPEEA